MPVKDAAKRKAYNKAYHKRYRERAVDKLRENNRAASKRYYYADPYKLLGRLWKAAKQRAATAGLPFSITKEQLNTLYDANRCCAVTKVPFDHAVKAMRPSIDRIDPPRGYVVGNVRLVLFWVNEALHDWGEEIFWRVFDEIATRRIPSEKT